MFEAGGRAVTPRGVRIGIILTNGNPAAKVVR